MAGSSALGRERTNDEKSRFTNGNLYAERQQFATRRSFQSLCRTMDFRTRLNIPPETMEMIGRQSCNVMVEIGYTGKTYECTYHYRVISDRKNPIAALAGGWSSVVDYMEIQQGDTVFFEGDSRDPLKIHASLDKNDKAIKVEELFWI